MYNCVHPRALLLFSRKYENLNKNSVEQFSSAGFLQLLILESDIAPESLYERSWTGPMLFFSMECLTL